MFVLTLPDTTETRDVKLVRLHSKLVEYLSTHGYEHAPSLQDLYQISAPSGFRSKRLQDWCKVFTLTKVPHTRQITYAT